MCPLAAFLRSINTHSRKGSRVVTYFRESRKEAGWAAAGKNRDLCAPAAIQITVLGAIAVGCQNLLNNYGRCLPSAPGSSWRGSAAQPVAAVPGRVAHAAAQGLSWLESSDPAAATR